VAARHAATVVEQATSSAADKSDVVAENADDNVAADKANAVAADKADATVEHAVAAAPSPQRAPEFVSARKRKFFSSS
jgi:hypothetical protein